MSSGGKFRLSGVGTGFSTRYPLRTFPASAPATGGDLVSAPCGLLQFLNLEPLVDRYRNSARVRVAPLVDLGAEPGQDALHLGRVRS